MIIVAGGSGSRMKAARKKAFLEIAGTPLLEHTVRAFAGIEGIARTIIVLPAEELRQLTGSDEASVDLTDLQADARPFAHRLRELGVARLVVGGARRQDSVLNGLWATEEDHEFVLVHDGARPLVQADDVRALMRKTRETGAAILAAPVLDTLKRATEDGMIGETIERRGLWRAQTPQAFRRAVLREAFSKHNAQDATDDAALCARVGQACAIVEGSALNFKITTPEDLELAELLLARPEGLKSDESTGPEGN